MSEKSCGECHMTERGASGRPVRVLVFAPGLIPSVTIVVLRPLIALEKGGEVAIRLRIGSGSVFSGPDMKWCDVAVFCRTCELDDLTYLYKLKRLGKKVIYEIDDNFEEISLGTSVGAHHRAFHRLHAVRRFVSISDLVRVYSKPMRVLAEEQGADVRLLRSYFDADLIKDEAEPKRGSKVKIAYPTGRIDDPRLEQLFYEALRRTLIKYRDRVEVHLWRKTCPEQLAGLQGVVLHTAGNRYEAFIREFYGQGYDIGLAPLIDEPFFRSKTNVKYRDFGGCGVAGIYSDMPPYSDCVVNGRSGILTPNTVEAWEEAIDRLVQNEPLRGSIVKEARQDVTENYSFASTVESYRHAIREVINKPAKPCNWLYYEKHGTVASFVLSAASPSSLNDESSGLARLKQFQVAAQMLRVPYHPTDLQPEHLVTIHAIQNEPTMVVFVVDSIKDLEASEMWFPQCRSIILDVSTCGAPVDEFCRVYERLNVRVPVSLIVSREQTELLLFAKRMNIPCRTVCPTLSVIESRFSLNGYEAAYLDVLERHIHHNGALPHSRLRRVVTRMYRRMSRLVDSSTGRLKRGWFLVQWRSGRRPL